MAEYLGRVDNLITYEDIVSKCGITQGSVPTGTMKDKFVKFRDNDKNIFIASSLVRYLIDWNKLNAIGLITGKTIEINGLRYLCRVPTGADNDPTGYKEPGGEWNRCIVDNWSLISSDFETVGGSYMTLCKETYNTTKHVYRESASGVGNIGYGDKDGGTASYCTFRAVLEQLDYPPILSIKDEDVGNILSPFSKAFRVSESNLNYTLTEKIDGTIFNTLTNQTIGTTHTLNISNIWDELGYGKHTIEIEATNTDGFSSGITYITFNKIKSPIATIPTSSTLTQAVNHMIELNKEIDYQESKLSNNLIAKGVEVLESDKMSNLIDKVGTIPLGKKWASGNFLETGSLVMNSSGKVARVDFSLDFTPSLIFITFRQYKPLSSNRASNFCVCSDISYDSNSGLYIDDASSNLSIRLWINNISSNGFDLCLGGYSSTSNLLYGPCTWYACE